MNWEQLAARADGQEIVLGAPGSLLPGDLTQRLHLFSFERSTGAVFDLGDLQTEAGGAYSFGPSMRGLLASRDVTRLAVTVDTRADASLFGRAIWLKNRTTGAFSLVTHRPDGALAQVANVDTVLDSMDAAGRYITFTSSVTDLIAGDTNGRPDVFVYDADSDEVRRVSLTGTGEQSPDGASGSAISPDGRFVAFLSRAALVPADTNAELDWYLRDLTLGTLQLLSQGPQGQLANGVTSYGRWSDDSRYFSFAFRVAQSFEVDGIPAQTVLYDRSAGRLRSLAAYLDVPSDGSSNREHRAGDVAVLQVSPSGRYALVSSWTLLPELATESTSSRGYFLADLQTHQIARVDMLETGEMPSYNTYGGSIVGDGPRVLFLNRSQEFGTEQRTLMHEWQPPAPSDLELRVEGPRATYIPDSVPRYTVNVTNHGSQTLNDVVFRFYTQAGLTGGSKDYPCYSECGLPPLAPGQTITLTFDIAPNPSDPAKRVAVDARVQSLSRFDATPSNNKVSISATPAASSGSGGGGGSLSPLALIVFAGLAVRRLRDGQRKCATQAGSPRRLGQPIERR